MRLGTVERIFVGAEKTQLPHEVRDVRALTGKGLEGDRYFRKQGTFTETAGSGRAVTLIEAEALEALARDYGIVLEPGEARRNLLTRGVALNHLVGRVFRVGQALLKGVRLCEPCGHLEKVCGKKGVREGLVHRGGLRAEVLDGGTIHAGDVIEDAPEAGSEPEVWL